MNKKEIAYLQKQQKSLKKEVIKTKKKIPTYVFGFILFTIISLYFLEDKFYAFFGSSVNFILSGVLLCGIVCLFFVYKSLESIKKKKTESKILGTKLYNMMKLEENQNE